MSSDYQDIREKMEADGYKLDDSTFSEIVTYARRKAQIAGKDETYLPYLLPDVIREWFARLAINTFIFAVMELQKNSRR